MASFILTSLMVGSLAIGDMPAAVPDLTARPQIGPVIKVGAACSNAAAEAVAMTGGEILSVEAARNGRPICKITVLVMNARGRPRKVKIRIPMD